jgi:hypothetical protein
MVYRTTLWIGCLSDGGLVGTHDRFDTANICLTNFSVKREKPEKQPPRKSNDSVHLAYRSNP